MRSFLTELARHAGKIALQHYQATGLSDATRKGRSDYVTHVDRRVEDAIKSRVKAHFPEHQFFGEETHGAWPEEVYGPCWIVDPIDGTTNYIRGFGHWAVSIAYCDDYARPQHAAIYDPVRDELFLGERGAGLWLNDERAYVSGCRHLEDALIAGALPFRQRRALDDVAACWHELQRHCEDFRRGGSAALDLAYVACGRLDAYWELGIQPWDVAAGELLVRCGRGVATDFLGREEGLLARRSSLACGSVELHESLTARLASLHRWLEDPLYRGVGG